MTTEPEEPSSSEPSLVEEPVRLGRRRDRAFAEALIAELPKPGDLDDKLVAASAQVWRLPLQRGKSRRRPRLDGEDLHRARLLKMAKRKLETGDIWKRIAEVYEVAADFTIVDAAKLHVQHIRGEAPGQDGEANYQALKDFQKMTLPAPAKQVQIDQRVLSQKIVTGGAPPALRARVLPTSEESK